MIYKPKHVLSQQILHLGHDQTEKVKEKTNMDSLTIMCLLLQFKCFTVKLVESMFYEQSIPYNYQL